MLHTKIFVLILIIYSVKCAKIMIPAVYEDFNDTPIPSKLKKVVLQDKTQRHQMPFQPDQQLNRYRKQQELDSYIQAYREQQIENQKINAQQLQWHAILSKQNTNKAKVIRQPKSSTVKPKTEAKATTFTLVTQQPYKVQEASDQDIEASELTHARLDTHGQKQPQITVQYPFVLAPNYVGKASVVVNSHQQTPHYTQNPQTLFPIQKPLESSESQHFHTYADNFKIVPSKELLNSYVLGQFQNQEYEAYLNKLLPNYIQQAAVKEFTPITEEAHESTQHHPERTHKSTHPTPVIPLAHENTQYASKYAFGYRVRDYHTGNDFGHEETRHGDTAKGHYHVLLPDGRIQNVNYHAGPDGYHATVTYHH